MISSTRVTFLLETGRILTRHHCPLMNRLAEARLSLYVKKNVFTATGSLGKPAEKVSYRATERVLDLECKKHLLRRPVKN